MSKRYSIFISALFCAFLGVFMVAGAVTPDKDFSPLENRTLAQAPQVKLGTPAKGFQDGNLFTGEFMQDFESYITDQFPLRDGWIAMKSTAERLLGKQENNGVYFGTKDTLITRFPEPDAQRVERNAGYVDALVKNAGVPVYFTLIPGASDIWADRLPAGAPNASQKEIIDRIAGSTAARYIDSYTPLWEHRDEDIYYRTDHHWTSLGAYYGYAALMKGLGLEPRELSGYQKETVTTDFYGTAFSTSGVRWIAPDAIDIYVPDPGVEVRSWFTGTEEPGALYNWDKLETKDKYTFFMGGNQSLAVVKNPAVDGPKLLLVRDSYSDSLVPFLTAHFSEIHLIDLRYNRGSVPQYIRENGIDLCVVLYSASNFVTDMNLFTLGRQ